MSTDPRDELIQKLKHATGELATQLAMAHGTVMSLITGLRMTELSDAQRAIVDSALAELKKEQKEFFGKYADQMGGIGTGRN